MITQEQLNRLLQEADKLHRRCVLAGEVGPDWFEPGMMEYLDQSDGAYDPITGSLIMRFEARGTRYDGRTEQIEKVQVGDEIRVLRDAENPFNPNNFTMTTAKGKNVGHMPAELCNAIAPLYDEGNLQFVSARASFVDPISKRNRHAKQGVLFVELCCSITGQSRAIAEQILPSRSTTAATPTESTAETEQTRKTNPTDLTPEPARALEPDLRKLLSGKHLEPLRTALENEGILSLDDYLKINLYGFIYSRNVYPPTRCKAIVASLRAKTQRVRAERMQQNNSGSGESSVESRIKSEKRTSQRRDEPESHSDGMANAGAVAAEENSHAASQLIETPEQVQQHEEIFRELPESTVSKPQPRKSERPDEAKTKPIAYTGQGKFLFVSYSHKDADEVYPLIQEMADQGLHVWYDEGLEPGSGWDDNVAIHIEKCELLIAMISHKYLSSDNCRDELTYARDIGKKTILVYTEKTELPAGMRLRFNRLFALFRYELSREDFYRKLFLVKEIGLIKDSE